MEDKDEFSFSGSQNIFAYTHDKERVFSIECKEISYQLMPAYVFYFSNMRMSVNLHKLVDQMHEKEEEYDWLENLTSTVSHEMRTPLGIIM